MDVDPTGIISILAVFGMPVLIVWIVLHYRDRTRRLKLDEHRTRSADDEMRTYAEKLERRVEALERLLDQEAPGWRRSE